jgi:hypothetical protein
LLQINIYTLSKRSKEYCYRRTSLSNPKYVKKSGIILFYITLNFHFTSCTQELLQVGMPLNCVLFCTTSSFETTVTLYILVNLYILVPPLMLKLHNVISYYLCANGILSLDPILYNYEILFHTFVCLPTCLKDCSL